MSDDESEAEVVRRSGLHYTMDDILLCTLAHIFGRMMRQWVRISDASIYRKYRYIVSISIYRIVSYRPPQYRFLTSHPIFVPGVDFVFLDNSASNKEFS